MSVALWKSIVSIQLTTSSISFVASFATVIMIARCRTSDGQSPLKTSPYHRIIFGLSISDLLQSIAIATGPFAPPASVPQALWGVGNTSTCRINGVSMILGSTQTPMYILMLCIYCLLSVKRTRPYQDKFPKRLEWMIHGFIILFNLCLCISGLITKSINPWTNGIACGISSFPTGCRQRPDIFGECDENIARHVFFFANVSTIGVPLFTISGIILSMGMICWHVFYSNLMFRPTEEAERMPVSSLRRRMNGTNAILRGPGESGDESLASQIESSSSSRNRQNFEQTLEETHQDQGKIGDNEVTSFTQHFKRAGDPDALMKAASREIVIQAFLFVLAFFVTYIFRLTAEFMLLLHEINPPMFVYILAAFFYPLGGLFNILVYTRPKVQQFRNGRYSWLNGFFMVIKAGVLVPPISTEIDRNDGIEQTPPDASGSKFIPSNDLTADCKDNIQTKQWDGGVGAAESGYSKVANGVVHVKGGCELSELTHAGVVQSNQWSYEGNVARTTSLKNTNDVINAQSVCNVSQCQSFSRSTLGDPSSASSTSKKSSKADPIKRAFERGYERIKRLGIEDGSLEQGCS